jgi:cellulose synthase/poly-beta-1,6-N-acetylglucosamine synthase-like glycosyltransferase
MQKIRIRFPGKAGYLKNKNAIVITEAAETWKAFWQQRIRWSSKADKYQDKKIFRALLLVYAFNFFLLVLFIGSVFYPDTLFIAILLLLSKTLVEFPFVRSVAKFFNQEKLMVYFAFLEPLHIIYVVVAGFIGKFGTYQWKGRKVK